MLVYISFFFLVNLVAVLSCGGFFENAAKIVQIIFVEFAVNAPGSLVGGNGIHFSPAAAGVLVEVHARISGAVHGRGVETGGVGKHWFRMLLCGCGARARGGSCGVCLLSAS